MDTGDAMDDIEGLDIKVSEPAINSPSTEQKPPPSSPGCARKSACDTIRYAPRRPTSVRFIATFFSTARNVQKI
jgi:hypothetical protein